MKANVKKNQKLPLWWFFIATTSIFLITSWWSISQQSFSLEKNTPFTFPKRELAFGVSGADHFAQSHDPIKGGELNLSHFVGYHQLRGQSIVAANFLNLIFRLEDHAYLTVMLDQKTELAPTTTQWGVRLSRHPDYPSAVIKLEATGELSDVKKLPMITDKNLHQLSFNLENNVPLVSLDHSLIHQDDSSFTNLVPFVISSGPEGVWLKKVQFAEHNITFLNAPTWANFSQGLKIIKKTSSLTYQSLYKKLDRLNPELEAQFRPRLDEILQTMNTATKKNNNEQRILFLGSSQTLGAGAKTLEDSWVHQVCSEWKKNYSHSKMEFNCLNAGIGGSFSDQALRYFKEHYIKGNFQLVVVNLAFNDQGYESSYRENMEELFSILSAHAIPSVMILEPQNYLKTDWPQGQFAYTKNHQQLLKLCARWNYPCLDLAQEMYQERFKGELFWDEVHLTNLGQKIFAQKFLSLFPYDFPLMPGRAPTMRMGMIKKAVPTK